MLVEFLKVARGKASSMISLIIKPTQQILHIYKLLEDEYNIANNIRSKSKLYLQSAIKLAQQILKLYTDIPNNGLIIYCGTILDNNTEKTLSINFEPYKPITTPLYICDNKFHTEILNQVLVQEIDNISEILLYLFNLKNIYLDTNIVDELVIFNTK